MLPKCRILVIGPSGSGKETLCDRLRLGKYIPRAIVTEYDPAEILPMTEWRSAVDGRECMIEAVIHRAWDLSYYGTRSTLLIIGIHGAFITYDATSPESFATVENSVLEIRDLDVERKARLAQEEQDYPIVVVGTKSDLIDKSHINQQAGKELVGRLGLLGFFQTSAKSGEGIEEPFFSIVREVRRREEGNLISHTKEGNSKPDEVSQKESRRPTKLKTKLRKLLS